MGSMKMDLPLCRHVQNKRIINFASEACHKIVECNEKFRCFHRGAARDRFRSRHSRSYVMVYNKAIRIASVGAWQSWKETRSD